MLCKSYEFRYEKNWDITMHSLTADFVTISTEENVAVVVPVTNVEVEVTF